MTRTFFLPLLIVKMLLKPQGCLNQIFEEENLIQSGHEQYFMRLWINRPGLL